MAIKSKNKTEGRGTREGALSLVTFKKSAVQCSVKEEVSQALFPYLNGILIHYLLYTSTN